MRKPAPIAMVMILAGIALCLGSQAIAADESRKYSGDLLSRSTLTGDWGGSRNDLAQKGISIDADLTQVLMGIVDGGKDTGWEYGGRGNVTLNADTQKLGLWPGGFFMVEVEGNYGNDVNSDTGALMPVNSSQLYPLPGENELAVPAVTFTQYFPKYFGVMFGKMDTTGGDANEFAHGKGDRQFMNLALNFIPVAGLAAPTSTLGIAILLAPTNDFDSAVVNVMAISTDGKASTSGFSNLFEENTTFAAEGRVKTDFLGLTGHQLAGVMYSNKDFAALEQNLRFIIQTGAIEKKDGTWCVYYNFDQYLYEPKKGSGNGIGIFGRIGVSDGNPNPLRSFFSVGIGGKGVVVGRPLDGFGLGVYYIDVKKPRFTGPLGTRDFLRDEYGIEAYYNMAITPWMRLTPDIQMVRPAQKRRFTGPAIATAGTEDVDTATVFGLRLHVIF